MRKLEMRKAALEMAATLLVEVDMEAIAKRLGKSPERGVTDPECHTLNAELHKIAARHWEHADRLSRKA